MSATLNAHMNSKAQTKIETKISEAIAAFELILKSEVPTICGTDTMSEGRQKRLNTLVASVEIALTGLDGLNQWLRMLETTK